MNGDGDFSAADGAASLLRWWIDAGVDVLLDERPRDWLKPRETPPAPDPVEVKGDQPPEQLGLFRAWLADSPALPYSAPAAPRVCPAGDPESDLMILTDMPSSDDCAAGILISGEAGRLFDRMLAAIGRSRDTVYLAALSCLRSPDGRFNTDSAKACAALARHHAGLVRPKALLIFGDAASKALIGLPLAQARGKWHDLPTHSGPVRALVTLPPSYLLNQPAAKAHAWADLQRLVGEVKP